jgi:hypothetical protein
MAIPGCTCYILRRPDGGIDQFQLAEPPRRSAQGSLEDRFSNYVSFAEAGEWERLRRIAHATEHRAFRGPDFNERRVGDAFIQFVIRDPKVLACVAWLSLEFANFRRLLSNGEFPSPLTISRFGAPLIFEGVKWPVNLDRDKLHNEIHRVALGGEWWNRPLAPPDERNPLFHTAQAIADQHKAFFDLLSGDELTAEGTSEATFSIKKIQNDQWSRPDRYLDVKLGDLLLVEDSRSLRKICTGIKLRLNGTKSEEGAAAVAARKAKPDASVKLHPHVESRSKRGPRPVTRERIAQQMLAELRAGKTTADQLGNMSGPALERVYKAHRDTCKHARVCALAEFQSRQ